VKLLSSVGRSLWILATITVVLFLLWGLSQNWQAFLAWKAQVGAVPFFVGMALLPLIGVPSTPLFVLGGVTFGLVTALAGSAIAVVVNLILSRLLARRFLHDPLSRFLRRFGDQTPAVTDDNAVGVLLLLRLTPGLPSALKNYASALLDVPFMVYLGVSWITTFLYAVGLVVLGDSLENASLAEAGVAALLLVAVFAGTFWYRKQQRKKVIESRSGLPSGNAREAAR
jgi:uncharacterized membrane protein YdjX (TVP38/TMEM64 family)